MPGTICPLQNVLPPKYQALSAKLKKLKAAGQFTPALQAQSQSQTPVAQQGQQKPQTFVGKIVNLKDGRFALLTDAQAGKGANLDDQQKAAQFEGKNVEVTGTLEVARALIHVTHIEPA